MIALARQALDIEQHYGRPMDIEWGKDGATGEIYILQAGPRPCRAAPAAAFCVTRSRGRSRVLATGRSIGQRIGAGPDPRHPRRARNGARATG